MHLATAFSPADVSSLVDQIYDDLVDGGPFQRSLDLLRNKLAATFAILTIDPPRRGDQLIVVSGETDCFDEPQSPDELGRGAADSVVPSRISPCSPDTFTADLVRWGDWSNRCHMVEAHVGHNDNQQCRLRLFRPFWGRAFDEEESTMCRLLLSHIHRATGLHSRLEGTEIERCLYSGVLDRLLVGTVLLDAKGIVVQTTSIAASVLADRSGLQVIGGRLRATCASSDRELQAIIKEALGQRGNPVASFPRAISLTRSSGARNLGVIVQTIPLTETNWGARPAALAVFLRDSERNADVENDVLRQLFDLTPAEATIARRLTAGLSLEEVAASLEISRNTARAHLRSIFSKSGITRQTELVRLILNSAAVIGQPSALAVH